MPFTWKLDSVIKILYGEAQETSDGEHGRQLSPAQGSSVHLMALAVASRAVTVLALAVVTVAVFAFHGAVAILLAVAFLAVASAMDVTVFALAIMARAIRAFDETSRAVGLVAVPVTGLHTVGLIQDQEKEEHSGQSRGNHHFVVEGHDAIRWMMICERRITLNLETGRDVLTVEAESELMIFSSAVLVYMSNLCFTSFSLFRQCLEWRPLAWTPWPLACTYVQDCTYLQVTSG
jgi:hypothetical protein